jgi:hypothetical protein
MRPRELGSRRLHPAEDNSYAKFMYGLTIRSPNDADNISDCTAEYIDLSCTLCLGVYESKMRQIFSSY